METEKRKDNKYQYHTNGINKVVCVSTYHHKQFRGVAKCSPKDTFSFADGTALARARCDAKIKEAKMKYCANMSQQAEVERIDVENFAEKAWKVYNSSIDEFAEASNVLTTLEKRLR